MYHLQWLLLFQVLKLKVDLVGYLALNSVFSKRSAEYCLADLVDKIGDAKNGSGIQETLSCIAEATSLDFVALQVSYNSVNMLCGRGIGWWRRACWKQGKMVLLQSALLACSLLKQNLSLWEVCYKPWNMHFFSFSSCQLDAARHNVSSAFYLIDRRYQWHLNRKIPRISLKHSTGLQLQSDNLASSEYLLNYCVFISRVSSNKWVGGWLVYVLGKILICWE